VQTTRAPAWICGECGARNRGAAQVCEQCGEERPAGQGGTTPPRLCPIDGATLYANGWCPKGDGYPKTIPRSPFVCPACRRYLEWSGVCWCLAMREEAPGDRYEIQDDHWRLVLTGPLRLCTPEENYRASRIVLDVAQRRLTPDEALVKLAEIIPEFAPAATRLDESTGRPEGATR
jgi:hypothetical protein